MRFGFLLLLSSGIFVYSLLSHAQEVPAPQKPAATAKRTKSKKDESPTVITADSVEAKHGEELEAKGKAELRKDDQFIRADKLLYKQESNEVFAEGSVRIEQKGTELTGPSLKMNLDKDTGEMVKPEFVFTESDVRGSAAFLQIESKQDYIFKSATYTSCPIGNDDWLLKMSELDLDRNTQIGTAYNARIEFMGVPFLYTPWMNFPLNDQRRSGLLAPSLGNTNKGGSEITIPVYLNIASNYDATITPRFIDKRGDLIDNEFRYLGNSFTGKLEYGEILQDKLIKRDRSRVAFIHSQSLGRGLSGSLNWNEVSDDAYFRDLSTIPAIAVQKNLVREAAVNYSGGWWATSLRAQGFQTLQDPDAPVALPYDRFPQVNLGAQRIFGRSVAALSAEYVDFHHPTSVNGSRVVFHPSVAYTLVNDPGYYVTPKLGVHNTQYSLADHNVGPKSQYERSIPIFSLDTGMTLERDFAISDKDFVQTLEPRLYYVAIPYENQDMLPNFDSAPAAFSFVQMFTENRFIGNDRIGDADQVTAAVTSRFLDGDTGSERLRVAVGERFSSIRPRVILGTPAATTNQSDVLMSVAGKITNTFSVDSLWQFNPNADRTEMYAATARYLPEAGKVFNLGYRYTFSADPDPTKTVKQVDFSTQWLLGGRWHMVAQSKYSLQTSRTVEALAGLEYNQDCWGLRMVAQQFVTSARETSTTIFLQLELREMIRVGTDPLAALRQSVPGYTILSDRPRIKPAASNP